MHATRIVAIRHGETAWNVDTRIQGHLDIPLNDTGLWQARQLARALADEPVAAIYTSDLQRARATAQAVADTTGAPLTPEPDLRERSFGHFQGRTFAQIEAELPEDALRRVFEERLQFNPGAEALISGLKKAGIITVLVSGGFTYFTNRLQKQLGFDYAVANELELRGGKLTGKVRGDIVDGEAKRHTLQLVRKHHGFAPETVVAAGDGANDLPMLHEAGIGIAYHAKPVVRQQATYALNHCGLDGILNLLG